MSAYEDLLVVSSASWVTRDLAAAGRLPVTASYGLDAPDLDGATALWCSGSWATRLLKSGVRHPFLAAGPGWLPTVPREFLRRQVWSGRLTEIDDAPFNGPAFYKLSEHKHSAIPAGMYPGPDRLKAAVISAFPGASENALLAGIHVTGSEPMRYRREYRCFVAHRKVTAASFYLFTCPGVGDTTVEITWDAYGDKPAPDTCLARAFAQQVVDAMGDNQPPGYVLDVGTDEDDYWSVIEANAAWSSNPYTAEASGVIEAVLASQEPGNDRWLWSPDDAFLARARPLPTPARKHS